MKYLTKIIWLVIGVVFLASVIVGIGVIFSVKNVNVSLESYSYKNWDDMDEAERESAQTTISALKEGVLGKCRGKLIGSVSDDKLTEYLKDTGFSLGSCERVYPCTLNLVLKERRETFAVQTSSGYSVYDENGEFLHTAETNVNSADGSPNVLINVPEDLIKDVASVSGYFAKEFGALRSVVEKVETDSTLTENMEFYLKCGIKIRIVNYAEQAEGKMKAAYDKFMSLGGEDKTCGTIYAALRDGVAAAERIY